MNKPLGIVEKSTVNVGTCDLIKSIFDQYQQDFPKNKTMVEIISNPEFMAEGTAVSNLQNPDRVIIGRYLPSNEHLVWEQLVKLYAKWVPQEKIITPSCYVGEISKIVSSKQ